MLYCKEIKNIPRPAHFGGDTWNMKGLKPVTLVMGKNGSGKTTLMDSMRGKLNGSQIPPEADITLSQTDESPVFISVDKITAERGGEYLYNGNISTSLTNPQDLFNRRKGSVAREFRAEVASRYDRLMSHISHNDNPEGVRPAERVERIIGLLNNLVPSKYKVERAASSFQIKEKKEGGAVIPFNSLSSGEIEMFTLGLECMIVANWDHKNEGHSLKVLLIDEPDVHIHPDLQSKFLTFLLELSEEYDLQIFACTHSTVFVASLPDEAEASILWMDGNDTDLIAQPKRKSVNELSALLGGNMVMQILLNHKIVLVEGVDELDVFNQAIRSAEGSFTGYINQCVGKGEMKKIETGVGKIMNSLYEDEDSSSILVSIRDRDNSEAEIENRPFVHRYRLVCHELENLIFSDEFLEKYGKQLSDTSFNGDIITADIKADLATYLTEITGSRDTNWQRELGQIIGSVLKGADEETDFDVEGESKIINLIGPDLLKNLRF